MIELIMNLISDLKICLAIALGSGFVLGYLYTKLRARDIYNPTLKHHEQKLYEQKIKSDKYTADSRDLEVERELKNDQLELENRIVKKHRDEMHHFEDKKNKLQEHISTLENLKVKKHEMLDGFNKEIGTSKELLGVDDTTKIDIYKTDLNSNMYKLQGSFKDKSDSLVTLTNEVKELEHQKIDLSSQISSLTAKLSKTNLKLNDSSDNFDSIKSKLQGDYDALLKNKEDNLALINGYKKKLLSIKDKFS